MKKGKIFILAGALCVTLVAIVLVTILFFGNNRNGDEATSSSALPNTETDVLIEPEADEQSDREIIPAEDVTVQEIVLSGNPDDFFVTDEYAYIEGDDYLIYFDRDLKIPGNFVNIIEKIISGVREKTGLYTDDYEDMYYYNDMQTYLGADYWKDIPTKNRIRINVVVDRDEIGWISCAFPSSAVCIEYELFDDELWNSIPGYRDNPWRRGEHIDYGPIGHELTHAITMRTVSVNAMGSILSEGIAQYVGREVDKDIYETGMVGYYKSSYYDYLQADINVTPENAEDLFRNDYHDLAYMERGAEYDYGMFFCEFLQEKFGDDFFIRIKDALLKCTFEEEYQENTENNRNCRTEAIKEEFGDDVFVKFGEWFQNRKNQ